MSDSQQRQPVVFLMGPTASGKTALAQALCLHGPFEIISVDSAMVYRGMDIGTAKPPAASLARTPHRLIDICDPSEVYSAGDFREDALNEIKAIHAENKIPLLVGGSGLYFRALERGIADLPPADESVRQKLMAEAAGSGWQKMHERLQQVDAASAERIHPNDPQRIQRALEVHAVSGRPLSSFFTEEKKRGLSCKIIKIIVAPADRSILHGRIRQRFEQMIELGLINEVESLYKRGDLSADLPSMRIVGYRQIWQYLQGSLGREEMLEKVVIATRQLAKRQLTWLRSELDAYWFDSMDGDLPSKVLRFLREDPILSSRV